MSDTLMDFDELAVRRYDPVLGLEVHVEAWDRDRVRMFDAAPNVFGAQPMMVTPRRWGCPRCRWSTHRGETHPHRPPGCRARSPPSPKPPGRTTYPDLSRTSRPQSDEPIAFDGRWRSSLETDPSSPSRSSGPIWRRTPEHPSEAPTAALRAPATPGGLQPCQVPLVEIVTAPSRVRCQGPRSRPPCRAHARTSSGRWGLPKARMERGNVRADVNVSCASRRTRRWVPGPTDQNVIFRGIKQVVRRDQRQSWPPGRRLWSATSVTTDGTTCAGRVKWMSDADDRFPSRPRAGGAQPEWVEQIREACRRCRRPSAVGSRSSGA